MKLVWKQGGNAPHTSLWIQSPVWKVDKLGLETSDLEQSQSGGNPVDRLSATRPTPRSPGGGRSLSNPSRPCRRDPSLPAATHGQFHPAGPAKPEAEAPSDTWHSTALTAPTSPRQARPGPLTVAVRLRLFSPILGAIRGSPRLSHGGGREVRAQAPVTTGPAPAPNPGGGRAVLTLRPEGTGRDAQAHSVHVALPGQSVLRRGAWRPAAELRSSLAIP